MHVTVYVFPVILWVVFVLFKEDLFEVQLEFSL